MSYILLWLYPKAWRQTYGDEFIALLDDLGWPLSGVLDAIRQGFRERIATHTLGVVRLVAGTYFAIIEYIAVRNNITRNMFWLPHGLVSGIVLGVVCACIVLVAFPRMYTVVFASNKKKE
jgi:hypothetical protein